MKSIFSSGTLNNIQSTLSGNNLLEWPVALFTNILTIFRKILTLEFRTRNLTCLHKRIRSMSNLKISLTRNSTLATVSNGLIFLDKIIYIENEPRFSHSESILQTTDHHVRIFVKSNNIVRFLLR